MSIGMGFKALELQNSIVKGKNQIFNHHGLFIQFRLMIIQFDRFI